MVEGVMFDFNGTLYLDADINEITWHQTIDALSNKTVDFNEFYKHNASVHDAIAIANALKMMNETRSEEEIEYWVQYKENAYRQYCRDHKRNQFNPGAEKVLDYLKEHNIPIGLCTSSIIENVEFYYENLKLDRWFSMDKTIYDTGEYHSKTEMYKDCAKKLGIDISKSIIFEDSPKPIREAIAGGCKNIIAIRRKDSIELSEIKQLINSFNELDYSIFENIK